MRGRAKTLRRTFFLGFLVNRQMERRRRRTKIWQIKLLADATLDRLPLEAEITGRSVAICCKRRPVITARWRRKVMEVGPDELQDPWRRRAGRSKRCWKKVGSDGPSVPCRSQTHEQAAAIAAQMQGPAREFVRDITPDELMNGGRVNGASRSSYLYPAMSSPDVRALG